MLHNIYARDTFIRPQLTIYLNQFFLLHEFVIIRNYFEYSSETPFKIPLNPMHRIRQAQQPIPRSLRHGNTKLVWKSTSATMPPSIMWYPALGDNILSIISPFVFCDGIIEPQRLSS